MDPWQSDAAPSDSLAADPTDKIGILIVDDNDQVRTVLSLGLQRRGFEVRTAENGLQALEVYARFRDTIAAVLLDVRMPEFEGPETLTCLRRLNAQLPICFITGEGGGIIPKRTC